MPTSRQILPLLAFAATIAIGACDSSSSPSGSHRTTQFGQDRYAFAVNANGETVSLGDFAGKPVWIDYAAEWCAACTPQSATIRALASTYGEDVVFVTVMTSEREGFGHPATQETAARWARRAALDPRRVVAADLTSMMLPQHALFSVTGTEVFRQTGSMTAAQIRVTIERID